MMIVGIEVDCQLWQWCDNGNNEENGGNRGENGSNGGGGIDINSDSIKDGGGNNGDDENR